MQEGDEQDEPQPDKQSNLALHDADVVDLGMGSSCTVEFHMHTLAPLVLLPSGEDGVGVGGDPVAALFGEHGGLQHGQGQTPPVLAEQRADPLRIPPDGGTVGGVMLGLLPAEQGPLEDHAERGVPYREGQVGRVDDAGDACDGVQRRGEVPGRLQEIAVEHSIFALEADENEVIVGAEGLPELQVERGLGLTFGEEGLEVVVESDLGGAPPREHGQDRNRDQDPSRTGPPCADLRRVRWRHIGGGREGSIRHGGVSGKGTPGAASGSALQQKRRPRWAAFFIVWAGQSRSGITSLR